MSLLPQQIDELHDLLWGLRTGAASPGELGRLERLVCDDPEVRAFYVRYMHLCADLHWNAAEVVDEPLPVGSKSQTPTPPIPNLQLSNLQLSTSFVGGMLFSYLVAAAVVGIGLTIAAFVHVSFVEQPLEHFVKNAASRSAQPSVVGQITGMADCQWSTYGNQPNSNSPIRNLKSPVSLGDRIVLRSGLLQISYDTGATVILQGPVTYKVESAAGGYLAIGKLTAKLEKKEEPGIRNGERPAPHSSSLRPRSLFAVRTPTAVVTDLGTEFAVEVSPEGHTISHVFQGSVEVQPTAQDGRPAEKPTRLTANQSARVDRIAQGNAVALHRVSVDPKLFVRITQLPQPTAEQQQEPLHRWQVFCQKLHRDPALIAHYDFQRDDKSPNVLHAVSNTGVQLNGAIHGAVWAVGRMPGKQSLAFDGGESRVTVNIPQKLSQMTLAAWIAVPRIDDHDFGYCLFAADWRDNVENNGAWQIYHEGQMRFGTPVCDNETPPLFAWQEWGTNRWRHLAVTTDPSKRHISFFLDGKNVHRNKLSAEFVAVFPIAQIGNWWSNHGKYERAFRGRIDELLVLARAMSDKEIAEMYNAGKK